MPALTASQERVVGLLKDGPRRAHELAARIDVDTSAIRRQLATLTALGLVEAYDVVEGPGRPKRHYRLTAAGRETGPRNYPLLMALLMRKVSEGQGRRALLRYLEAIAADLAGPPAAAADARKRLDLLLVRYNDLGFDATARKEGASFVVEQRNCPFLAAAAGDEAAICVRLDEGMMRAAFPDYEVVLEQTMAGGAPVCRHRLVRKRPRDAVDVAAP